MKKTVEIIECDVCGADMKNGQHHGISQFTMEFITRVDVETHSGREGYDEICLQCSSEIINFIKQIEMKRRNFDDVKEMLANEIVEPGNTAKG